MSDDVSVGDKEPPRRTQIRSGRKQKSLFDAGEVIATKVISELSANDITVTKRENIPEGDVRNIELIERRDQVTESSWRRWAITLLLVVFVGLNAVVLAFICLVWRSEISAPPANRIVTERVMLALIGGSVAQLGALALGLGRALTQRKN